MFMAAISLNLHIRQVHHRNDKNRMAGIALQRNSDVPFVPTAPTPVKGLITRDSDLGEDKRHQRKVVMRFPGAGWMGREHTSPQITSLFHSSSQRLHLAKVGRACSYPPEPGNPIYTQAQALAPVALWVKCHWRPVSLERTLSENPSVAAMEQVCGFLHSTPRPCTVGERGTERKRLASLVYTTTSGSLYVS